MTEENYDRLNDGIIKESNPMPFLEHLEELRWRLIKSVLSVIICAFAAFNFAQYLVIFIKRPLGDVQLYNIAVTGTFYAYIKISLICGLMFALPYVFFQLWSFIAPGLYKKERLMILPLVFISTLLFLVGSAFCFEYVLPVSFDFLIGFGGELVANTITIGSYISFVGLLLMAFGFGFQMPLVSYFLGKMGLITAQMLGRGRRYAIVGILIVGAIITPPDVFTQFMLAVPLYILYEVSIIIVRITQKKKNKEKIAQSD